jgi:DNA-directed RNA polymerase specialized sigma24 family protein
MDALIRLSSLPREYREVLLLREVQKQSYDQIAEQLGLSRDAVSVRLTGARRELMRLLGMADNAVPKPMRGSCTNHPEVAE